MKKGYILLSINIEDPHKFQEYPQLSQSIISKYGGKYLFRGGKMNVIEGDWPWERNVLVEFENVEKAKEFYNSIEYQEALKIRQNSAKSKAIIIEGY
ncbi:MAG: D-fructose-6-phosphate amidotransferase [Pelagibacteraceae bacterium]|jgi:uncharacterized protein (DUF1330 family)|nr:D-fructose-6-phosphate amidotransferase [Pelagibacteraceae bacterium]|tara:strand:- start:1646 stop:1936 length:291 start_codon:yes stop_codon:yes gene_type:complete